MAKITELSQLQPGMIVYARYDVAYDDDKPLEQAVAEIMEESDPRVVICRDDQLYLCRLIDSSCFDVKCQCQDRIDVATSKADDDLPLYTTQAEADEASFVHEIAYHEDRLRRLHAMLNASRGRPVSEHAPLHPKDNPHPR